MEPAAKKYSLEINKEIDERYNIEKSTQAACDYLKEAYSKFGNWTLVAQLTIWVLMELKSRLSAKTKNYYNMF